MSFLLAPIACSLPFYSFPSTGSLGIRFHVPNVSAFLPLWDLTSFADTIVIFSLPKPLLCEDWLPEVCPTTSGIRVLDGSEVEF